MRGFGCGNGKTESCVYYNLKNKKTLERPS